MKKVSINLKINKLVFAGDFPEKNEIIYNWYFKSSTVDRTSIINLYQNIYLKINELISIRNV